MMTLIEEMRLFLRQICGAIGMSGAAANVVPVVVLGVVFNVVALSFVANLRPERRPACQKTTLRDAAQTEWKVMRTVVVSTMKTIGMGQRGLCIARTWVDGLQREAANAEIGATMLRSAPVSRECSSSTKALQQLQAKEQMPHDRQEGGVAEEALTKPPMLSANVRIAVNFFCVCCGVNSGAGVRLLLIRSKR